MLKGYISQYWQQYNTFACIGITHCMYEIGCIDIVVSQQIWNNTYVLTTWKLEGWKCSKLLSLPMYEFYKI